MTFIIAAVYVSKPLSYISILSTIPGIFKRLAITLFHAFPLILLIYTAYLAVFALICTLLVTMIHTVAETNYVLVSLLVIAIVFLAICDVLILVARAHAIASWSCANVVSILEPNTYGSTAINRSKLLLQEKEEIIKNILVLLHLVTDIFIWIVFLVWLYDMNTGRVLIISLCAIALAAGNFLGLTAQNLIYYVCTGYDIGKRLCDDCDLRAW
ncbi:hypothetical protein MKX03_033758 [Papaver bracteatum]|nr:hypothetical protein MKX03_033758 [Papaver bracteatum]